MYTYTHSFYGVHEYEVKVEENHKCLECIHMYVCNNADWFARFCENYSPRSEKIETTACWSCKHYLVMNDPKESVPCFKCKHYLEK